MSRMLKALKQLEAREPSASATDAEVAASAELPNVEPDEDETVATVTAEQEPRVPAAPVASRSETGRPTLGELGDCWPERLIGNFGPAWEREPKEIVSEPGPVPLEPEEPEPQPAVVPPVKQASSEPLEDTRSELSWETAAESYLMSATRLLPEPKAESRFVPDGQPAADAPASAAPPDEAVIEPDPSEEPPQPPSDVTESPIEEPPAPMPEEAAAEPPSEPEVSPVEQPVTEEPEPATEEPSVAEAPVADSVATEPMPEEIAAQQPMEPDTAPVDEPVVEIPDESIEEQPAAEAPVAKPVPEQLATQRPTVPEARPIEPPADAPASEAFEAAPADREDVVNEAAEAAAPETEQLPEGPIAWADDVPPEVEDERIAALGANLLEDLPQGRAAVVLFTSAEAAVGKTAVVAELARWFARRIEGGVLAADVNLRRPQLADSVGVDAGPGLAAVLAGRIDWQDAVRLASSDGLDVLPASASSEGKAALDLAALAVALEHFREQYRMVLLDGASLAEAEVAPLARLCDGTCLVLRLGQTTQADAEAAVEILRRSGGRLLGCIVTDAETA